MIIKEPTDVDSIKKNWVLKRSSQLAKGHQSTGGSQFDLPKVNQSIGRPQQSNGSSWSQKSHIYRGRPVDWEGLDSRLIGFWDWAINGNSPNSNSFLPVKHLGCIISLSFLSNLTHTLHFSLQKHSNSFVYHFNGVEGSKDEGNPAHTSDLTSEEPSKNPKFSRTLRQSKGDRE